MPSSKSAARRITASTVLDFLANADDGVDWHALKSALVQGRHGGVRELRLVLKGLLRNGELEQDHRGFYHRPGAGEVVEGVLVQQGKKLYLDDFEVMTGKRNRLRAGDRVRAVVQAQRAQVVEVLAQSEATVVGELNWHGRYPYVESFAGDFRGRISLVEPPDVGQHGDIVRVRVLGEERRGLTGQVVDIIRGETVLERAVETQLECHRIPRTWPKGVRDAVEALPAKVSARTPKGRVNLKDLPLVTIDGETAKDFDDAVFAEAVEGGWRLVVAIADVAHYVKKGSALDEQALERGNSVYLPQTVVPMLPEALSNELCSLKPQVPRLAMVCEMQVARSGEVESFQFHEALIRSWQRLTYTQVAAHLAGRALDVEAEVVASLGALHQCYLAMSVARDQRGALDFESHEAALIFEEGRVREIQPVERNDAHRLIEEAMIAANVCSARFLEDAGYGALYRVHDQPEAVAQADLRSAFAMAGVRLQGHLSPQVVQQALQQLGDRPDIWVFQMLVLRSLPQAVYVPGNRGHFGLALERYMHFTSPIRRYADLVVHRAIKAALKDGKPPYAGEKLEEIGSHISFTERRAEQAEWGVEGWLKCDFVADRVGETFDGRIASVTEFGLFVELTGFFVQGLVHVSELGDDFYRFQAQNLSLVGERSGQTFRLGDDVTVKIREVRPPLGRIDLELVGGGRSKKSRRKGRGR